MGLQRHWVQWLTDAMVDQMQWLNDAMVDNILWLTDAMVDQMQWLTDAMVDEPSPVSHHYFGRKKELRTAVLYPCRHFPILLVLHMYVHIYLSHGIVYIGNTMGENMKAVWV